MATYGLTTYKSDGTTVILENSSQSAVYGKAVTLNNEGTGATRSEPIPFRQPPNTFFYYYLDFPEYTGRTIVPIQLRPGLHEWTKGVGTTGTLNGVPFIRWFKNQYQAADYGVNNPDWYYETTVLYVFVK
jgi:hypothetical protein